MTVVRLFAVFAVLALAGCTPPGGAAQPFLVQLGGTSLRVEYPNGIVCRAEVPMDGGSGRFADCPLDVTWTVDVRKRNYLEPVMGSYVEPYATITLTDGAGRAWVYATPPRTNWRTLVRDLP